MKTHSLICRQVRDLSFISLALIFSLLSSCSGTSGSGTTTETLVDLSPVLISASSGELGDAGDGNSKSPSIAESGALIAFESTATNLVTGDTNGVSDVFLRNISTLTTTRVSLDSSGNELSVASTQAAISSDGTMVAYTRADSAASQIVLYDVSSDSHQVISIKNGGSQADPNADGNSSSASVSSNGRFVAFVSSATNLLPTGTDTNGVADIYVRDTVNNTTTRVSVSSTGVEANAASASPRMSTDGGFVVFTSTATNLVAGDTNAVQDVFLHDISAGTTMRVSVATDGTEANGASSSPSVSENGTLVIFTSTATNLVSGDTNAVGDVFSYTPASGIAERISFEAGTGTNEQRTRPAASAGIADDGRFAVMVLQAEEGTSGPTQALSVRQFSNSRNLTINPAEGASANTIPLNDAGMSASGEFITIDASNWPITLRGENIGTVRQIIRVSNPLYTAP